MVDKVYVEIDFKLISGKKHCVTKEHEDVIDKFKLKKLDKFPLKLITWQTLCSCVLVSDPYVVQGNMNSKIFIKDCLEKRFLVIVRKLKDSVIFWLEFVSCHYSAVTLGRLEPNRVVTIPKDFNLLFVPAIRPIGKYWAINKTKLKKIDKATKNAIDLLKL